MRRNLSLPATCRHGRTRRLEPCRRGREVFWEGRKPLDGLRSAGTMERCKAHPRAPPSVSCQLLPPFGGIPYTLLTSRARCSRRSSIISPTCSMKPALTCAFRRWRGMVQESAWLAERGQVRLGVPEAFEEADLPKATTYIPTCPGVPLRAERRRSHHPRARRIFVALQGYESDKQRRNFWSATRVGLPPAHSPSVCA